MKIIAAVARQPGQNFNFEYLELECPRPGEVLVQIKGVGLCHTDLTAKDAPIPPQLPAVLGHEGSGVVTDVGEGVVDLEPGDHVILSFSYCGSCSCCRSGEPAYCQDFLVLNQLGARADRSSALRGEDGPVASHFFGQSSFASHVLTYANNCVKVSKDLPIELLGPLACGVQTGAGAVLNTLDLQPGQSLVVLGGGTVGLSAVMAAAVRECATIVVVDPLPQRRDMARELGATAVVDPIAEDLDTVLTSICPGGFSASIDTTARPDTIETAIRHLAGRGTLVLLGLPADPNASARVPLVNMLLRGQRVVGVIEGDAHPKSFIPYLISLYQQGRLPFDKLIRRYAFEDLNQAVVDQKEGLCVKPVMIMGAAQVIKA